MIRTIAHVGLFLVGIASVALNLHELDAMPFWGWSLPRLERVRQQREDFDTLFLGTSRMHYAVIPTLFDERSAQLGRPSKSFNLAFSGTRMLDSVRILRWLVENKPPNLKRVVVELHTTAQEIRQSQWMTNQELEMHAPCVFFDRMRSIWVSRQSSWTKLVEFGYCMAHSVVSQLCVGQGMRILRDRVEISSGQGLSRSWDEPGDGWTGIEDAGLEHLETNHMDFLTRWSEWEEQVRQKIADASPEWLGGGFELRCIQDTVDLLRSVGIEPVFVVMPSLVFDFTGRDAVEELRASVRVLELDRPAANRPAWDRAGFYDRAHIDTAGARLFSKFLAERLVECEQLPLHADPSPREMPARGIEFTARHVLDGSGTIEVSADELPFAGTVIVIAGHEKVANTSMQDCMVGIQWPPQHCLSLERDSVYRASAKSRFDGRDPTRTLFLQLGVMDGARIVGVSRVVELPPDR